jgi:hypothetical protein
MKQLSIFSFATALTLISLSNRAKYQSLSPYLYALLDAKLDSMHVVLNNKSLSGATKISGTFIRSFFVEDFADGELTQIQELIN